MVQYGTVLCVRYSTVRMLRCWILSLRTIRYVYYGTDSLPTCYTVRILQYRFSPYVLYGTVLCVLYSTVREIMHCTVIVSCTATVVQWR